MPGAHEQGTEMCSDVGERFLPSLSLSTPPIPPDFWTVLQEMGADFAMGSGLLGGSLRALCGSGSADLGKRWCPEVFRVESACKTAQKLRAVFTPLALQLACFGDSRTNTFAFGFAVQNT